MRSHCALLSLDLSLISQLEWLSSRTNRLTVNIRDIPPDGTLVLPCGNDFIFSSDCQDRWMVQVQRRAPQIRTCGSKNKSQLGGRWWETSGPARCRQTTI